MARIMISERLPGKGLRPKPMMYTSNPKTYNLNDSITFMSHLTLSLLVGIYGLNAFGSERENIMREVSVCACVGGR